MKRYILAATVFAAFTTVAALPPAQALTTAEQQKILVLKKKKAADLKKAEAAKKAADLKMAEAARKAGAKKQIKIQQASFAATQKPAVRSARTCKGFIQCLFGARHGVRVTKNPLVQQASLASGAGLSGMTTHEVVDWNDAKYPVGSIIVRTPERALYYVSAKGEAIRYSVGVGKEGMQWSGSSKIVSKQEWPSWTPPQVMIEREAAKGHIIPDFMEGGPGNPLGARAMYIGGTMYRVHGTNNEASIGGAVSSGCIRMMNADVIDLYERVKVGARIYVYQ